MVTDRVDLPEQFTDAVAGCWDSLLPKFLEVHCDVELLNKPTVDRQGVEVE
jgi:hypothetical protein